MPDPTPLFLLNTVLMPGGVLPLRVFERRYLDMLARCMRQDQPFAVVAIDSGQEVGPAARPNSMGTLARIGDWDQGADGVLEVVAEGLQRVRVMQPQVLPDQLTVARVEVLPEDPTSPLPQEMDYLAKGLDRLLDQVGAPYSGVTRELGDAVWVGNRLVEVLPMPLPNKQRLLETLDPMERMRLIEAWIMSQQQPSEGPS